MSNLLNNRVNATVTPAQVAAVKNAFQTILANLPFLVGLTVDERKSLLAIDVSNKAFTEDAINAAVNNATLVPSFVSVSGMQTDLALFVQLDEISGIATQLCEKLDDTKLLVGSEAYQGALTLYRAFGTAANAGFPGADSIVDQLKKRFQTTSTTTTVTNEAPPLPVQ